MMLPSSFFRRPVLAVARDLLGKTLVRERSGRRATATITEVEAYDGPKDLACHGRFGRTARTAAMFLPGGHWYVYLVYGAHWMLNIVTGDAGYPAAVLIRGARGETALNGPGRLTKVFGIDRSFNALPANRATGLWIEDRGIVVPLRAIQALPRIGVDYAGAWTEKPWRFVMEQELVLRCS
jgi:DNA-3-methyladenine glycosylase